MKHSWLKKTGSDKLIIFFNGWGMDDFIVSHLDCEDYDVLVLYDYNNLDINFDIEQYKEKHVVAWSMGVLVSTLIDIKDIKTRTAVCGTPYPIHNAYGIPERIYNLTIKNFDEKTSQKFMERMFTEKPDIENFSSRSTESKKSELVKMLEYKPAKDFCFTKAIIADTDLIIPAKNQLNFWKTQKTSIEQIHSGHCPFFLYKKWSELIG